MAIFSANDNLQLLCFPTYGTDVHFYVRGRAFEDEYIDLAQKNILVLLRNTWRRFETDEVRHSEVEIRVGDKVFTGETNDNGYYRIEHKTSGLLNQTNNEGWLSYTITFVDHKEQKNVAPGKVFQGSMLIPNTRAEYGVISDIDDTILHTGVTSFLKIRAIFNTFFTHVGKRLPLPGSPELYQKFHKGKNGKERNPIFYVSNSPWNLFQYLNYFLDEKKFPRGPILLRELRLNIFRKNKNEKPHKIKEIENIIKTYPYLKFILIGDCGEKDPIFYKEIAENHPDRILAIYLRSIKNRAKMKKVAQLYEGFKLAPVRTVTSSAFVENHARGLGFI